MPNKNKLRGTALETEVVNLAKESGLKAQRAWGSNGNALGFHKEVDCLINNRTIQCKRMKKFPKGYKLLLPDTYNVEAVVFREDGAPLRHFVCLDLLIYLDLVRHYNG